MKTNTLYVCNSHSHESLLSDEIEVREFQVQLGALRVMQQQQQQQQQHSKNPI